MSAASAISLQGMSKSFSDSGPPVLRELSLVVEAGECVSIIGASGSGKSTLLAVIAGLITPDAGKVQLDPADAPVGFVFQEPRLLPWRTALGNVEFSLQSLGLKSSAARQRALEAIALVRLEDHADKFPHQLSGGMQQRVALARALAIKPKVLLLDEPLASLDALTRTYLQEEIATIARHIDATTILVTHDIDEAIFLGDRVMVMSGTGSITSTINVPLSPERTVDGMVDDPHYARLRKTLRKQLRVEAETVSALHEEVTSSPDPRMS